MRYNILITANGSLSCELIAEELKKEGHSVVGTNIYPSSWVGVSHLFEKEYQVPKANSPDYIKTLLKICQENNIKYIFPLTDVEIDEISNYRKLFQSENITLCMPSDFCISISRNKKKIFDTLQSLQKIKCIPTYTFQNIMNKNINGKIIAKPFNGRSSEGQFIFNKIDAIKHLIDKTEDYIFQPFINGEIYVVDYIRDTFGNDYSVSRKELLRTSNGAGLSVEVKENPTLSSLSHTIGEYLGVLGSINMEFIFDGKDYFLMDINPRFSAGINFSSLSGYNLVKNHLKCFTGNTIDKPIAFKPFIAAKRFKTYKTMEI